MFVNDLADPLQHEFIQAFVLLSNGDGQVEDNRVFQGLFFNLNVQLITFCEASIHHLVYYLEKEHHLTFALYSLSLYLRLSSRLPLLALLTHAL